VPIRSTQAPLPPSMPIPTKPEEMHSDDGDQSEDSDWDCCSSYSASDSESSSDSEAADMYGKTLVSLGPDVGCLKD